MSPAAMAMASERYHNSYLERSRRLAYAVEANRQAVEQTWQRVEGRRGARPPSIPGDDNIDPAASSAAHFRGPGRRGARGRRRA